jgi:predicted RND superfamily exporter protein
MSDIFKKIFEKVIVFVCTYSYQYPLIVLTAAMLLSIPALQQLPQVGLDTDLIRLLPDNNKVVQLKRTFDKIVTGSGGFFAILLESSDKKMLMQAFHASLREVNKLEGIGAVEYMNSRDFFKKYCYLLIPSSDLERILEFLLKQEARLSPVGVDLLDEEQTSEEDMNTKEEGEEEIKDLLRYIDMPQYHQSQDGRVMAIKVYPEKGVTSLGKTRKLFVQLENIVQNISESFNVWGGVSGSLRNDLDQYAFTISDLSRSGLITVFLVLIALVVGFRNLGAVLVVLLPLSIGLIWTLGSIPVLVGDLNTITSFLMLVSFGLGIDFSIHLVKRFQYELHRSSSLQALLTTFLSTGKSILISGLTTALALFILSFSNFKGFSEFGLISGYSIIMILIAALFILPSILVLGLKVRLIKSHSQWKSKLSSPGKWVTLTLSFFILAALIIGVPSLNFNYDFSKMEAKVPQAQELKDRYYQVYESSRSPGALFIAKGEKALDELLSLLKERTADETNTRIQRFYSIRELSPGDRETRVRLSLIKEIKEILTGRWVYKVKDPDHKKFINHITQWIPPERQPGFDQLPGILKERVMSKSHPDHYIIPVYIKGEKQKGKNAIAFTRELSKLNVTENVIGPYGETPVLAHILQIVTKEGPWLIAFTFLGIFLLIFSSQRSLFEAIWIMIPLITGLILTIGIMAVIGLKLNFFNIVVFPTLIGIGVDDGVHYFNRWKENNRDSDSTQKELFVPLSLTTVTTMFAYMGIAFSRHPGLQSIGVLASIGLACTWLTSLFLLPGLLKIFLEKSKYPSPSEDH